jgi:phosphoglycerate dehydrogenase-like enzyme
VAEIALAEALRRRRPAAAGLDVFAHEALVAENNPFMDLDSVVLMPTPARERVRRSPAYERCP